MVLSCSHEGWICQYARYVSTQVNVRGHKVVESGRGRKRGCASASLSRVGSGEADLLLDFIVSWKVVRVKGETSCLVLQRRLYDEHGGTVGKVGRDE